MSAAEIHRQSCARGLRPKCSDWRNCKTVTKDRRTNEQMFTMKSEVVGWPPVVNDVLVKKHSPNKL
jgi:hypothetical protein